MEDLSIFFSFFIVAISCTVFAKVLTVLSVLRLGLGMKGFGFGLIVLAFSALLSWYTMTSVLKQPLPASSGAGLLERLEPFLEKHKDPKISARLESMSRSLQKSMPEPEEDTEEATLESAGSEQHRLAISGLAFLITELTEAFHISFFILLPFIIVDILVLNLFLALGVTGYSHEMVALPIKLLLFFAIDGWILITEKLLLGYSV